MKNLTVSSLENWSNLHLVKTMPYLYSGPDDQLCMLRGENEDSEKGIQLYWDGSKDRWISHVSTRVSPDTVSTLLHTSPVDVPIPATALRQEAEETIRFKSHHRRIGFG